MCFFQFEARNVVFSAFCSKCIQIDTSQNQWNKSSFFRTNWQHEHCEHYVFVHDKLLLLCKERIEKNKNSSCF